MSVDVAWRLLKAGTRRDAAQSLTAITVRSQTTVQLQKRDSNAKPNKIPKEDPRNIALSDHYDNIDTGKPIYRNNRLLNRMPSMPSQYTLTSMFQTALVAAVKCAVVNTSASQQTATSAVHQSSEPRQPFSLTNTRLLRTAGSESEINVLHSDTNADFNDAAAIEMSAAES